MSMLSKLLTSFVRSVTLETLVKSMSVSGRAKLKEQLEHVSVVLAYASAVDTDSTTISESIAKATTFVNSLLSALE